MLSLVHKTPSFLNINSAYLSTSKLTEKKETKPLEIAPSSATSGAVRLADKSSEKQRKRKGSGCSPVTAAARSLALLDFVTVLLCIDSHLLLFLLKL
jgi:hypothetical protein